MKINRVLAGVSLLAIVAIVAIAILYFKTATQYDEYRAQVNNGVKDPGSTQFRNEHLSKNTRGGGLGSVYCAEVNSKNSYGAFIAFERVIADPGLIGRWGGGKYGYVFFERDGLDGDHALLDADILLAALRAQNNAKERKLTGGDEATLSEKEYQENAVREVFEKEWSENCSLKTL